LNQFISSARSTRFTASGLHDDVRALHRQGLRVFNAGWICAGAALGLSLLGFAAIGTTEPAYASKHLMHLSMGLFAAAVAAFPGNRWLQRFSYPLLVLSLLLLMFVLLPFVPDAIVHPRNGARRWINILVFDLQPSELAKIAYVLALACWFKGHQNYRTFRGLFIPFVGTFIPMGLILIEPDLGTALVFVPTLFAMLIAAGGRLWHVILIVALGLGSAPLMYPLLQPHQKDRIMALVAQSTGDDRYVQNIGFQGDRAMMLVGSGGLTGAGKRHAADLVRFNGLPEEHNDMIFAVVCCRWGALGAIAAWGLFASFALGAFITAATCKDAFSRLVPVGLTAVILTQMIVNTGMTIGVLPITGMTLPFVSAGGSSMITSWLMVGVIYGIALRRPRYMSRDSLKFSDGHGDE
jgi:cell division protein FtsW (lipid II flippase)